MAFMKTSVAVQKPTTLEFESRLPGDGEKLAPPAVETEVGEEEEEEETPLASEMPSQTVDN